VKEPKAPDPEGKSTINPPEDNLKLRNMLMGSIALYLEDHPEIEAGKDKPKT